MVTGFRIVKPGIHSLIQDLGRTGHYANGITMSGPADKLSFLWANRLCGNRSNSSALELTFGGLEFETTVDAVIAVTGPEVNITCNDQTLSGWRSHRIRKGSHVRIARPASGIRNYLAVGGGFVVDPVFGSTATTVREMLGGIAGRALARGDMLTITPQTSTTLFALPRNQRPDFSNNNILRVIPAWQAGQFTRISKRRFFGSPYQISPDSNRMAYRLTGDKLDVPETLLMSEGILPGAIQIPPDGQPIVMHCDHQTIGGYPKIGTVITVDLWRLAQLTPATSIRFKPVTPAKAQRLMQQIKRQYEATQPFVIRDKDTT
jgi:biotin-dependent carboxylase-like uncharacterized protein